MLPTCNEFAGFARRRIRSSSARATDRANPLGLDRLLRGAEKRCRGRSNFRPGTQQLFVVRPALQHQPIEHSGGDGICSRWHLPTRRNGVENPLRVIMLRK